MRERGDTHSRRAAAWGAAVALVLCLRAGSVRAQVVEARIDSLELAVGQQTDITLDVTVGWGQRLTLPALREGAELVPGVEVVEVHRPDTTALDEGRRLEIRQRYTVTAWDSSFYYLPPLEVTVDGKRLKAKSLALKVHTVDVDTLHADRFFPPSGVMDPPFEWADWRGVVWSAFLVLALLLCAACLCQRAVSGKPLVRIIRRKRQLPPHKKAIDEIERIKAERKWAEEDSKEYYTLLTDTLRTYIKERYGFNAREMTSAEIIERLTKENDEASLSELREIFSTADLVKFAKHSTLINENDANLVSALQYVNQTKQEPGPEATPEPEVIRQTDRRRMTQVRAMKAAAVAAALLAAALLGWAGWRVYDLLI